MTSPPPPPPPPLAPGFRFHPTDEELVGYYLKRKVAGLPLAVDAIAEVDLYKWSPWDLPPLWRLRSCDRHWFFFSPLDCKSDFSLCANRATAEGFWKSSGKDRPVFLKERKTIGMKKCLVFHVDRAPNGRRTDWVMHEYRLEEDDRVFKKTAIGNMRGDEYGAPLIEEEWVEEEARDLAPAAREAAADVLMIAAAERDQGHADDFEQGTTKAMRNIDQLTIGYEASSSNLNPPSKGLLAPGF